ncbi:MAG: TraR/DksA C4-type zinc finger protein [Patescibacteria group bacterium]
MNSHQIETVKTLLIAEQKRLEQELASFASPDQRMRHDWDAAYPKPTQLAGSLSHSSQEEQADIREEFETELAQEQSLELRLREVTQALERIAAGTFGACAACGRPIPAERLEANPAAAYDMEHLPKE